MNCHYSDSVAIMALVILSKFIEGIKFFRIRENFHLLRTHCFHTSLRYHSDNCSTRLLSKRKQPTLIILLVVVIPMAFTPALASSLRNFPIQLVTGPTLMSAPTNKLSIRPPSCVAFTSISETVAGAGGLTYN